MALLSHLQYLNIRIIDSRPGFVATPLLNGTRCYLLLMGGGKVAYSIASAIQKGRRLHIIDRRLSSSFSGVLSRALVMGMFADKEQLLTKPNRQVIILFLGLQYSIRPLPYPFLLTVYGFV